MTQMDNRTATILKYCKKPVFAEYTPKSKKKKEDDGSDENPETGG